MAPGAFYFRRGADVKGAVLYALQDQSSPAATRRDGHRGLPVALARYPTQQPFFVSPLYLYFLARSTNLFIVRVAQVLLGAMALLLVFDCARLWFRRPGGDDRRHPCDSDRRHLVFMRVTLLQAALDPFLVALTLSLACPRLLQKIRCCFSRRIDRRASLSSIVRTRSCGFGRGDRSDVDARCASHSCCSWRFAMPIRCGDGPQLHRDAASRDDRVHMETPISTRQTIPTLTAPIITWPECGRRSWTGRRCGDRSRREKVHFYGRAWNWMRANPASELALFAARSLTRSIRPISR